MRVCSILAVVLLALTGCASGERASDPPASAVRDARSSVASLVLALGLVLLLAVYLKFLAPSVEGGER